MVRQRQGCRVITNQVEHTNCNRPDIVIATLPGVSRLTYPSSFGSRLPLPCQRLCASFANHPLKESEHMKSPIPTTLSFGNPAMRCTACAKHSKQQCKNPAVKGFTVCRMHGARGGPRTQEGVDRIAMANRLHGRETRAKRLTRQEIRLRLKTAIAVGEILGMFERKIG